MTTSQITPVPRIDLRGFTSPVQFLPRLSKQIGVEVWAKRDDLGSVGLAGNKVRKLETELAHAQALGATHIVTEGSRHSNAARAAAAAAAAIGMKCTLVLCHEEPKKPVGNLFLDALFGADLRLVGDVPWVELAQLTEEIVHELEADGERVHRLPIGSATGRGATSFAQAYIEADEQIRAQGARFNTIVHASSAGSTHAGLALGRAISQTSTRIVGIIVAGEVYDDVPGTYLRLANEAADLIAPSIDIEPSALEMTEEYLGEGYGKPASGVAEAIDLMARLEGIVVDPVYTAKAVAAIIDMARKKNDPRSGTVLAHRRIPLHLRPDLHHKHVVEPSPPSQHRAPHLKRSGPGPQDPTLLTRCDRARANPPGGGREQSNGQGIAPRPPPQKAARSTQVNRS